MKQCVIFTAFIFVLAFFIISGCALSVESTKTDLKPVINKESTSVKKNNFDLHVFTTHVDEKVPCFYWTLNETTPVLQDLIKLAP